MAPNRLPVVRNPTLNPNWLTGTLRDSSDRIKAIPNPTPIPNRMVVSNSPEMLSNRGTIPLPTAVRKTIKMTIQNGARHRRA